MSSESEFGFGRKPIAEPKYLVRVPLLPNWFGCVCADRDKCLGARFRVSVGLGRYVVGSVRIAIMSW